MNAARKTADAPPGAVVLLFGDAGPPGALRRLPAHRAAGPDAADTVDGAVAGYRRLVVVGDDADLAAVLTRLLRTDRLDVEVGYAPSRRTAATRVYRLPSGWKAARRACRGAARRVPLIRDETGSVIVGEASWLPAGEQQLIHGEAVVDDTILFDGEVAGVCIQPALAVPGLRASVHGSVLGGRGRRWVTGRAVQLGGTGAAVVRDGVLEPRAVRRSTFYRHVEGWLLVR